LGGVKVAVCLLLYAGNEVSVVGGGMLYYSFVFVNTAAE